MKKKFAIVMLLGSASLSFAQSGGKWSTGGNALSTGDFLGSTNNFPLDFKVNNVLKMKLKANGTLQLDALNGTGNSLLQTDANGNIRRFAMGLSTQYLAGDGNWIDFPAALWNQVPGSNGVYTNGFVGIGNSNPQYALDISGDLRVKNDAIVGGSIDMGGTNNGISFVPGTKTDPSTLKLGPINGQNPALNTCYLAPANSWITQTNDMVQIFGNYAYSLNNNNVNRLSIGYDGANDFIDGAGHNLTSSTLPTMVINYYCGNDVAICTNPANGGGTNAAGGVVSVGQNFQAGFPIYDVNTVMNVRTNGKQGTLFNGSDNSNTSVFHVDYTGNTIIGKTVNPGYAATKKLDVVGDVCLANYNPAGGVHAEDGFSGIEILGNNGVPVRRGMSVDADPNGDFNFYINSNQPSSEFNFRNGQAPTANLMSIVANGHVYIGTKKPVFGQHDNSLLSVYGDITTTAVYVTDPSLKWADFVFEKNYKLMDLKELESYYRTNGHLPNVPTTKEVQENGVSLAENDAMLLQKVEELTLYLVQQQKEIEALKAELKKKK